MNKETIELANSLSLNQMVELIELFSDKIRVYVGQTKAVQEHIDNVDSPNSLIDAELSKELPATTNGVFIQINLEFTDQEEA